MNPLKPLLATVLLLAYFAAGSVSSAQAAGDAKAGEQKAAACVGCHGNNGQSNNSQWPNLAGQQADYLNNQLSAFKSGARSNPTMQAMAANLSDDDIANLSAYFSGLPAASSGGDAGLAAAGKEKAAMCLGCHGPSARGNGAIPRLAGQHSDYLASQLTNFKQGARTGGPMQGIASSLSDDDIKGLAAYFGSLK